MTEIIKSRYLIETTEIQVNVNEDGRKNTTLSDLNLRVKDCYTRMPIGGVILEGGVKYKAFYFFATERSQSELPPPPGGWGPRFDLAANAIWKKYSESLPKRERARRWAWRWMGLGWLLIGALLGTLGSVIGQLLIGSDCSASQ